ncbi:MAG: FtsW/RodA/SpoVE family cell cycle protein, partial [Phototrophicaceae bacterium]
HIHHNQPLRTSPPMNNVNLLRRFDYTLFGVTILLVVFGVLMIRSATTGAVDTTLINRVPDQIRYGVIGLFVLVALSFFDYRLLIGLHNWLYGGMMVLLILVPIFGVEGEAGGRLWLNLGILIQPSEIAKLVTIITLAHYLAVNYPKLSTLWGLIQSLFHMLPPILLVFFQPDLGATIVFVVIWIIMVWGAGLRLQHIALGVFIGIAGFPVLWTFMEPYQRDRITTYAQCSILGACAADDEDYYNIRQALISIGNGGLSGRGYANGTQGQLRFLRVRHTDFIFSQIAEEFGFIGSVVVMGLFWVILERILRGAREAADAFGSLICYGVAGMIFFQIFVSIGMNLSLIPVTGLTLPLVSSGGTSLLSIMAAIGLAESVIMRRRRIKG